MTQTTKENVQKKMRTFEKQVNLFAKMRLFIQHILNTLKKKRNSSLGMTKGSLKVLYL
jgi:hypothetical protein